VPIVTVRQSIPERISCRYMVFSYTVRVLRNFELALFDLANWFKFTNMNSCCIKWRLHSFISPSRDVLSNSKTRRRENNLIY
jgi:hypothetical protein